ncbi:recombination-associated protein RdgC [Iodobacter fluviatilis]|nr:recombination-associated protein RdgC [Iodobacter fluviatilis]
MKLIKNAIVFNVEMPTSKILADKLEARPFIEPTSLETLSIGFVGVPISNETVINYEGGMAFAVRIDEKVIPNSAIELKTQELVAKVETEEKRKVGKKERRDLKDIVATDIIKRAIAKTSIITVFFDTKKKYLIIPISSSRHAQMIINLLIIAIETLKTSTIHINSVTKGITALLCDQVNGNNTAFGHFNVGDHVQLQRQKKEKVTFNLHNATAAAEKGFIEALDSGFEVKQIQLISKLGSFNLTEQFHLKSIAFDDYEEAYNKESFVDVWMHEAAVQTLMTSTLISNLCEMIGYLPEEQRAAA